MANNNISKYLFGQLYKYEAWIIVLYSAVCLILALREQEGLLIGVTLLFSMLAFFNRKGLALSGIIISAPFLSALSSGLFQILPYIPFIVASLFSIKGRFKSNHWIVFFYCIIYILFSYSIGYESDMIMLCLQIVAISSFFAISESFTLRDVSIVVFSYICSGLLLFLFVNLGGFDQFALSGRLSIGENVKTLAYICAIPMSFLLYSFISQSYLFSNIRRTFLVKSLEIAMLIMLLVIVIMTLARGLLLSLIIGALLLVILSKNNGKTTILVSIIAVLSILAFNYIESLDIFRTERIFAYDEFATGNGRTDIWMYHFNSILDMGGRYFLFGTGPGNIARITSSDAYAHSTIFDFFFSYGLIGFVSFIVIEFFILRKLFAGNNLVPFIVVVTFLLAYSTHGVAANTSFFVLQALMIASQKTQTN